MFKPMVNIVLALVSASLVVASANAADPRQERGEYLVQIGGCTDCHTPGHFRGHPDATKNLGGSDVGFAVPGHGVFVGPNLTPDRETGLGNWTEQQIATAITTGTRPDGRILVPVMPWVGYAHLSQSDALAIAAYLHSLPPVSNKVAGPFAVGEMPSVFVMSVQPGDVYAALAQPK